MPCAGAGTVRARRGPGADNARGEEPNYLNSLSAKYYSLSVTARAFSSAEREWMDTHDALHVGYLENYLPYSDTDADGQIALVMVKASEPGYYDAVLTDIQMTVMDGYAAARAIRAPEDPELSKIPILAMTANAFQEDVQAAIDAGMQAHIAKPIEIDRLAEALRDTIK